MRYPKALQLFRRLARCVVCVLLFYFGICRLRSAPSVRHLLSTRYSGAGSVLLLIMHCVRIPCFLALYRHVFVLVGSNSACGLCYASLLYFVFAFCVNV